MKIIVRKKEGSRETNTWRWREFKTKIKEKNECSQNSKTSNVFLKATQMSENMNRTSQTADSFNIINEQMLKVMESTVRLLNNRGFKDEELCPKMFI